MSKLNLSALQKASASAAEVIKAIAGESDEAHPDDSKAMCRLWDDLNDCHAPPAVVKAMADELINLRQLNARQRAQRVADRRRYANPAPKNLLTFVSKELADEQ